MNERPSATCGTVEQGVAAVGLSPTLLSVLCLGLHELLSATAGRSDELALLATNVHIYMEVSLYREAGGGGLQACRQRLLGLPEHVGQQLPAKVTPCCVAARAAGAPMVCVVCEMALAQPPLLWPQQQGIAKTTSAQATRKGRDAGVLQWPCRRRKAVVEGAEPWDSVQMCFKVVRQAETWARAGKAGLLLEKSWMWSTAAHLNGSRSRVCLWE